MSGPSSSRLILNIRLLFSVVGHTTTVRTTPLPASNSRAISSTARFKASTAQDLYSTGLCNPCFPAAYPENASSAAAGKELWLEPHVQPMVVETELKSFEKARRASRNVKAYSTSTPLIRTHTARSRGSSACVLHVSFRRNLHTASDHLPPWTPEDVEEMTRVLQSIQNGLIRRREEKKSWLSSKVSILGQQDTHGEGHVKSGPSNSKDLRQLPAFRRSEYLPQSPIFHAIHQRSTPFKERPTKDLHSTLSSDPYAKILTSPIRACQATGVRLPRDLLVGWRILRHPTQDINSLVPTSLSMPDKASEGHKMSLHRIRQDCTDPTSLEENLQFLKGQSLPLTDDQEVENPRETRGEAFSSVQVPDEAKSGIEDGHASELPSESHRQIEAVDSGSAGTNKHTLSFSKLHPLYLLPRLSLLKYLTSRFERTETKRGLGRLAPIRWKAMGVTLKHLEHVNWRTDMPEFVPMLMRLRVIYALKRALLHANETQPNVTRFLDRKSLRETIGHRELAAKGALLATTKIDSTLWFPETQPVPSATTEESSKLNAVPIFDGPNLLGPKLATFIDVLESRRGPSRSNLLLLTSQTPEGAQLVSEIWRLHGYFNYDLQAHWQNTTYHIRPWDFKQLTEVAESTAEVQISA